MLKILLVLITVCTGPLAFAQVDCKLDPADENVLGRLAVLRSLGCYGGSEDKDALAKDISALENINASTDEERLDLRWKLVKAAQRIEAKASELAPQDADWNELVTNLRRELEKSTEELRDNEQIFTAEYWEWNDHEVLQQEDGTFLVSYQGIINNKCPPGNRPGCAAALGVAIEVNRYVDLTKRLHQFASHDRLTRVRKRLAELDADWDNYFFHTRSQYIWELAINSWRFKGKDDVFAEPPSDQLMFLHPGLVFEYVGGGAQNDDAYDAILMAELIGYNRFKWPARKDGRPSRLPPLGISIVGTYSPDNDGEHVGYGVMIHVENVYSFGVARRDTGAGDETVYLFSADLMKLILKASTFSMDNFRGAGGEITRELVATEP